MKRNNLLKASFFFVFALAVLAGCRNEQSDVEADVAVPVSVVDIKLGSIEEFTATTGTVMPTKEVDLATQMAGEYKLMNNPRTGRPWALGDRIQEGEVIVSIQDEEYVNNIQLKSKELNLEISKDEWEKIEKLYEKGGETLRTLKNAEQTYINAQYTLDNARLQLAKMQVKSPFTGVVVDLPFFTPGTEVAANTAVVSIMEYNQLYMEFQLPEKSLAKVDVAQNVRILNYTLPDDTLWGRISQMSPAINPETRNFKGLITISNPDLRLRPGSYVKAEIITSRKDSTIVIPKDIMVSRQRGKSVFIVEQNTAYERSVKTGLENPDEVEVIGGLEVNNRVVTEGFETLGNRSKVKIIR